MLELLGAEFGDVGGKLGIAVAELVELLAIMAVDLGLDRVGAGHRGLFGHQRGRGARARSRRRSRPAGAAVGRTRRSAISASKRSRWRSSWPRHAGDQVRRGRTLARARRAGRHRSGSRHIRRPGRRAASTARSDARSPGRQPVMRALHASQPDDRSPQPSERIAFQPAMRNAEEGELHLVAADQRRLHDVVRGVVAPPRRVQVVSPSNMPSSTPA